jgi:hypothetical protein
LWYHFGAKNITELQSEHKTAKKMDKEHAESLNGKQDIGTEAQ